MKVHHYAPPPALPVLTRKPVQPTASPTSSSTSGASAVAKSATGATGVLAGTATGVDRWGTRAGQAYRNAATTNATSKLSADQATLAAAPGRSLDEPYVPGTLVDISV